MELCSDRRAALHPPKVGVAPNEFRAALEELMEYGGWYDLDDIPDNVQEAQKKDIYARKSILVRILDNYNQRRVKATLKKHAYSADEDTSLQELVEKKVKLGDDRLNKYYYNLPLSAAAEMFPLLPLESDVQIVLHSRNKYMSARLLKLAKNHRVVVAVVGKAYVAGIAEYWERPVDENQLLFKPSSTPYHIREVSTALGFFVLFVLSCCGFGISVLLPLILIFVLV